MKSGETCRELNCHDNATPNPALRCWRCCHRTGRAQRAGLGGIPVNVLGIGAAMALTEYNIRRYRVARGIL